MPTYDVPPFSVRRPFPFCIPSMTTADLDACIGVGTVSGLRTGIVRGLTIQEASALYWTKRGATLNVQVDNGSDPPYTISVPLAAQRPPKRACYDTTTENYQIYASPVEYPTGPIVFTRIYIFWGYDNIGNGFGESGPLPGPLTLPPVVYDSTEDDYVFLFGAELAVFDDDSGGEYLGHTNCTYSSDPIFDGGGYVTAFNLFGVRPGFHVAATGSTSFQILDFTDETEFTVTP